MDLDGALLKALALADSLANANDPTLSDGLLPSLRSSGISLLADNRAQQVLQAIRLKAKQLAPSDIPALASAIGGELKTSIGLDRVARLVPLAASFDNPDSIQQFVLASPYSHGGAPDGSLYPNWGLILPLVHQYFP